MNEIFNVEYIDNFKIFLTAILIYVVIYALLLNMKILGDDKKINSLVAIVSAIIVSFTGIVTYIINYAITWFIIIIMIFLMIFMILAFLGVKLNDIHNFFSSNSKVVLVVVLLLFSVIFFKGFFGVNNTFDINEPQENQYNVNTNYNTGVDDITNKQVDSNFFSSFSGIFDNDMIGVVFFLFVLGIFVFIMG